jgi:hypothetical protein
MKTNQTKEARSRREDHPRGFPWISLFCAPFSYEIFISWYFVMTLWYDSGSYLSFCVILMMRMMNFFHLEFPMDCCLMDNIILVLSMMPELWLLIEIVSVDEAYCDDWAFIGHVWFHAIHPLLLSCYPVTAKYCGLVHDLLIYPQLCELGSQLYNWLSPFLFKWIHEIT